MRSRRTAPGSEFDRRSARCTLVGIWVWFAALLLGAVPTTAAAESSDVRVGVGDPAAIDPAAPGDAPRRRGASLTLPRPPPGFNSYSGDWIRFSYPPGLRERVQPLIESADQARSELSARLGQHVLDRVIVYVARTPGEMASLAPEGAPFPKYASGVAYPELGLVLLTISPVRPNDRHELGEVFQHELAHLALDDAVRGAPVPRWFNEGFAVFASGESSFPRLNTLWLATLGDDLLKLTDLERTFPVDASKASIAYAEAADIVRFLVRREDHHRFSRMVEMLRAGRPFPVALNHAYGIDPAQLEYEWREDVSRRYTFWPVLFSGSVVWFGALGLFVWGYRRRRRQHHKTLRRWEQEEALEAQRERAARQLPLVAPNGPVHIVFSTRPTPRPVVPPGLPPSDVEIPRIEHDGRWHTLH
ncbi:MAG: hypothetical protein JW940_26615 [Polyangiaceae bacterium]|nr:hypothetical protein [Polyangiaceae bacterium]